MSLQEGRSSGSEPERDTLGPLPAPCLVAGAGAWAQYPAFAPPAPHNTGAPAPPAYGPGGLGPIYNPAPPPSAYMAFQGSRPLHQSARWAGLSWQG